MQPRSLRHDELSVADVTKPLAIMDTIDYDDLRHARVEHVIATLQRHGRNHLLVMDREGNGPAASGADPWHVRSVLSRAHLEGHSGRAIEVPEIGHSFAVLGQMLP